MFVTSCESNEPAQFASLVVGALGDEFGDDAPFSPDMTAPALDALGTCVAYLRDCLGPARTVAIPDRATLATVLLAVHVARAQLHAGVQAALPAIDRRQWPADQQQMPLTQVAALRAALAAANGALAHAATGFAADAHAAATEPATPPAPTTNRRPAPGATPTHDDADQVSAEPSPPATDSNRPPAAPGA
jgi:hypothetical protein